MSMKKTMLITIMLITSSMLFAFFIINGNLDDFDVLHRVHTKMNAEITIDTMGTQSTATAMNPLPNTLSTMDLDNDTYECNYSMNHIWKENFFKLRFTRIYVSDLCKFAYFTTLKTASLTTRKMIDIKQCGWGKDLYNNWKYWKTCGDHECNSTDYSKLWSSDYYNILFTRHPIARFESIYNFWNLGSKVPTKRGAQDVTIVTNISIIAPNEVLFLNFVQYFEEVVTMKRMAKLGYTQTRHLQPIYLYSCVVDAQLTNGSTCFTPSFVGKTETLIKDMHWLEKKIKN
eukprot:769167_1